MATLSYSNKTASRTPPHKPPQAQKSKRPAQPAMCQSFLSLMHVTRHRRGPVLVEASGTPLHKSALQLESNHWAEQGLEQGEFSPRFRHVVALFSYHIILHLCFVGTGHGEAQRQWACLGRLFTQLWDLFHLLLSWNHGPRTVNDHIHTRDKGERHAEGEIIL